MTEPIQPSLFDPPAPAPVPPDRAAQPQERPNAPALSPTPDADARSFASLSDYVAGVKPR